jgi:CRP-like cAMP-binding protein
MAENNDESLSAGRAVLSERFQTGGVRVLKAGQLMVAGAKSDEVLCRLRSGWAYRFSNLRDGNQAIVDIYLPGDVIVICDKEARNIRTLTTAAVEVISGERGLFGLMVSSDVATYLYQLLNDVQRRADRRLASIVSLDAQGRMAAMVLDFYWRLETQKLIIALSFHLPMTQYHIGGFLGVTPVHVNRVISSLRDAGIVNIEKHHVSILNLSELADLANADLKIGRQTFSVAAAPVAAVGGP